MNILITNYFYSVEGVQYFFNTHTDALDHLLQEHTELYFSCINPTNYVQKFTRTLNLKVIS